MANTSYISTQHMNKELESLKGKTKLKVYQIISSYYDEMKYRRQKRKCPFEEDTFSKNVENISKSSS